MDLRAHWTLAWVAPLLFACGGTVAHSGQAAAKPDIELSAGAYHTCALDAAGALSCWGDPADFGPVAALPTGRYAGLALARGYVCLLDAHGLVSCAWLDAQSAIKPIPSVSGSFVELTAARWDTCGLRADGHVVCWSDTIAPHEVLPDVTFTHIALGDGFCGIPVSGKAACWTLPDPSGPPTFTFSSQIESISGGWFINCALAADGSAHCIDVGSGSEEVHPGPFTSVGGGESFGCGLALGGSIECWGAAVPPPGGPFEALGVGMTHACALTETKALKCWIAAVGQALGTGDPPQSF